MNTARVKLTFTVPYLNDRDLVSNVMGLMERLPSDVIADIDGGRISLGQGTPIMSGGRTYKPDARD